MSDKTATVLQTFDNIPIHGMGPVYKDHKLVAINFYRKINHLSPSLPDCLGGEIEISQSDIVPPSPKSNKLFTPPPRIIGRVSQGVIIESPNGSALVDLQSKNFWAASHTHGSYQAFTLQLPNNEIPLYANTSGKIYSWKPSSPESTTQGVIARKIGRGIVGKLKVEHSDFVLQDRQFIGVLHPLNTYNTLQVIDLKNWSGVAGNTTRTMTLPKEKMPTQEAKVTVRFKKHIALIQGQTQIIQQRWRRVSLFNYGKNKEITNLNASHASYPIYATISPHAKWVVVESVPNRDQNTTRALSFYSLLSNRWHHTLVVGSNSKYPKLEIENNMR
ncbi:MAG: hypothetical protein OXT67_13955 [Zetaproteobacteria bacterium]|nr:hypothetical protein [Zetaproteobacteria bacterium]